MKIAIIYHSKYGSVKQYALWIGENIPVDILNIKTLPIDKLEEYDCLIFGDSITYSQLHILSFLKKYKSILINKKLLFYICGLSNKASYKKDIQSVLQNEYPIFFLPGYYDYSNLTRFDKFQIYLTTKFNKKSKFLSNRNKNHLFKKENCNPIISNLKSIN